MSSWPLRRGLTGFSVTMASGDLLIENSDLAETFLKALGGETPSPIEQFQLETFFYRVVSNVEWTYYELPEASSPAESRHC